MQHPHGQLFHGRYYASVLNHLNIIKLYNTPKIVLNVQKFNVFGLTGTTLPGGGYRVRRVRYIFWKLLSSWCWVLIWHVTLRLTIFAILAYRYAKNFRFQGAWGWPPRGDKTHPGHSSIITQNFTTISCTAAEISVPCTSRTKSTQQTLYPTILRMSGKTNLLNIIIISVLQYHVYVNCADKTCLYCDACIV